MMCCLTRIGHRLPDRDAFFEAWRGRKLFCLICRMAPFCTGSGAAGYQRPIAGVTPALTRPPNHDLDRLDRKTGGTVLTPEHYPTDESLEVNMGRGLLLWLIGIPIPIIILIWLLGGLHG
jgi:hypothetical protein